MAITSYSHQQPPTPSTPRSLSCLKCWRPLTWLKSLCIYGNTSYLSIPDKPGTGRPCGNIDLGKACRGFYGNSFGFTVINNCIQRTPASRDRSCLHRACHSPGGQGALLKVKVDRKRAPCSLSHHCQAERVPPSLGWIFHLFLLLSLPSCYYNALRHNVRAFPIELGIHKDRYFFL